MLPSRKIYWTGNAEWSECFAVFDFGMSQGETYWFISVLQVIPDCPVGVCGKAYGADQPVNSMSLDVLTFVGILIGETIELYVSHIFLYSLSFGLFEWTRLCLETDDSRTCIPDLPQVTVQLGVFS